MSIPDSTVIKCSKCSFSLREPRPTRYAYKYDNCLVDIPWHVAWCADCNTIVIAEHFANLVSFREQLERAKHSVCSLGKEYAKVVPGYNYMDLRPIPKEIAISTDNAFQLSKIVGDLKAIDGQFDKLLQAHMMTAIVSLRHSAPKCLLCGSTNTTKIEIHEMEEAHRLESAIHPNCGGILYATDDLDGLIISWNMDNIPTRIYDLEGNFIGTEERPGP